MFGGVLTRFCPHIRRDTIIWKMLDPEIWTTRTQDNSYPRELVPRTTRTPDDSYPGQLVSRTPRTQDNYYPTQDDSYPGQLVPRTTRTQGDSLPAQVVPRTTLAMLYLGQLVSRTSRNYSQIMTILSNTFPLLVIFVAAATTIYALILLNEFIIRKKMQVPVLSVIKHGSLVSYQVLACQFSSNREVWFIGG